MRIAMIPAPARGHLFPMIPLAWALRDAGHQVVVIAGGDAVDGASQAGLLVLNALDGVATDELHEQISRRFPELFTVDRERDPIEAMAERKPIVVRAWDALADAHIAMAQHVRPDFIVYDPIFGVGSAAAAKLGVPALAHAVSLADYPSELLHGLDMFTRHGLTGPPEVSTVLAGPTSLRERVGPRSIPMRFVPYGGDGEVPPWVFDAATRARVLVTFGTLGRSGDTRYLDPILDLARRRPDLEFVMTMVEDLPNLPRVLPENFRPCGWLPLQAVLATCSGVIHHGGLTSVTCAAHGIPQLVVPHGGPDMMAEAELLRRRGAALVAQEDLSPDLVEALVSDASLQRTSQELRAENAALPQPSQIVEEVFHSAPFVKDER